MPSCDGYGGEAPMGYPEFLVVRLIEHGTDLFTAREAVASTFLDHPPPYPDSERHTYSGWVRRIYSSGWIRRP